MNLTRTGIWVLGASFVLVAFGIRWRYTELIALGGLGLVAVATAWLSVHRPTDLEVRSRALPRRVVRGVGVPCRLRIANRGIRVLPPVVLVDRLLDSTVDLLVAGVGDRHERLIDYSLAAARRGVHPVGPLLVRRQDLLGLVSFERTVGHLDELIVHPTIHHLAGSRGVDHISDVESMLRRATADPMAGFQSLREYQRGDDTRTIHWASTARLGHLMVREFVDARRPRLTVVLDTAVAAHSEAGFEEAVDVAASLCAHAISVGLDVILRTNDRRAAGTEDPIVSTIEMLDLLARVERTEPGTTLPYAPLLSLAGAVEAVMIITGARGDLPRLATLTDRLTFVRIGVEEQVQRAGLIAARDAVGFRRAWTEGGW